jgi:lysyl endopeptidase
MRREFFFLFTFIILSHTLKGQISHGGQPLPLNTDAGVRVFAPAADLFIDMPKFNEQEALWRSGLENSKFKSLEFAHKFDVHLRPDNSGFFEGSVCATVIIAGFSCLGASSSDTTTFRFTSS